MAQTIKNIKAGQKFIVVQDTSNGFPAGCIVEAMQNQEDCTEIVRELKWIGGFESDKVYKNLALGHHTVDLKRYRGKIK